MSTPLAILALIAGLGLLVFGSEFLVAGAARLARRLGLTPFTIGVTVVAFGTSAPELFASVGATLKGQGTLAVGNVVGSNIANVLLILGLTALVRPVPIGRRAMRIDIPAMVLITLLVSLVFLGGEVGRVEGGILVAALLCYITFVYKTGKQDPEAQLLELELEAGHGLDLVKTPSEKPALSFGRVLIGLAMLTGGAELLVQGATKIATDLGVETGIVGLTIVAFGTSLPELAASLRAAMTRQADIAVGNIVGSNVFNLLSVLGIASLVRPLPVPAEIGWSVGVMIAAAVLCLPVMGRARGITRWQGGVMLAGYLAYVVVLYVRTTAGG